VLRTTVEARVHIVITENGICRKHDKLRGAQCPEKNSGSNGDAGSRRGDHRIGGHRRKDPLFSAAASIHTRKKGGPGTQGGWNRRGILTEISSALSWEKNEASKGAETVSVQSRLEKKGVRA